MSSGSIAVELLDHMGDDLSVVNAARVSFDKESEWVETKLTKEERYWEEWYNAGGMGEWKTRTVPAGVERKLSERDTKLIKYLAEHDHWSPFSHAFAKFRITAPVFVARQLQKHTVGLAWNEVSRRYVDSEPTFYTPDVWRKRAENVKQGSSDEPVLMEHGYIAEWLPEHLYGRQVAVYHRMLELGVCPEQARMVLPQSMMTEWIWSGSLFAFARVCNLRLDSHAQYETRLVAEGISEHMAKLFPESWKVLINV